MPLTEIEFELPSEQFARMEYPNLQQGQSLTLQLETQVLTPHRDGAWYAVQKDHLSDQFVRVGRAQYAFAGQIMQAQLERADSLDSAALIVQCGEIPVRALCAPDMDGKLPYGTWETRYLAGYSPLLGIIEDDFSAGVGKQVTIMIWSFHRLVLRPGDAKFGDWYETTELLPTPYEFDRVVITARVHRPLFH